MGCTVCEQGAPLTRTFSQNHYLVLVEIVGVLVQRPTRPSERTRI